MKRRTSVVLLALALVACSKVKPADQNTGSATPTTQPTPPPPPADAAAPVVEVDAAMEGSAQGSGAGSAEAAVDFDKLSHDEKIKIMKTKVMPAMKPAFQKFDAKEYANFGCKTCHGKDPQKTKYKMPNPELKPLDFAAIQAGKEDKKYLDFMEKTVKPEMAKILGMPEMTDTQDGFGCLDCHTQKKK